MTFFDPKGNEITSDAFVKFYSACYYLSNSIVAEKEIETFLSKDLHSIEPFDVMRILEWKLGRIDYKRSQCEGKTWYRHWDEMNKYKTKTRSGEIDAKELCEFISKDYGSLKKKSPCAVFSDLAKQGVANLGTVYIITLVYFITQECPIYDRFAHQAIIAIKNDNKPGEVVKYATLPSKTESNAFQKYESCYFKELVSVFPNYMDRDVDRALWVYGHLFQ